MAETAGGQHSMQLVIRKFALLLVPLAIGACSRPTATTPPPPRVDVVQPLEREVTEWDEYTARLEAVDSVEVRPRVSGYLQAVHFREGAIVHKGDPLFTID